MAAITCVMRVFTSAMAASAVPARASTPMLLRATLGLPLALPMPLTVMPRAGALAAGVAVFTTVCGVHAAPSAVVDINKAAVKTRFEYAKLSKVRIAAGLGQLAKGVKAR